MSKRFNSFREFYPYYLHQHAHPGCRRLHFVGVWLVLGVAIAAAWVREPWLLLLMPVVGYGTAWVGHFYFEHNTPATFSHPWYSLAGDWVMWKDILTGRIRL